MARDQLTRNAIISKPMKIFDSKFDKTHCVKISRSYVLNWLRNNPLKELWPGWAGSSQKPIIWSKIKKKISITNIKNIVSKYCAVLTSHMTVERKNHGYWLYSRKKKFVFREVWKAQKKSFSSIGENNIVCSDNIILSLWTYKYKSIDNSTEHFHFGGDKTNFCHFL